MSTSTIPRTIGLLGGMSWESSIHYEQIINTETRRRLGGSHSAELIVRSYDFARIEALQAADDWAAAGRLLTADARSLVAGGAGCIVLCTNTMHEVADQIAGAVDVPFLHIGDATAAAIATAGLDRVGLLGTRFTMERPTYADRLRAAGIDVVIPDGADRQVVDEVIYGELVRGIVRDESRARYLEVIDRLVGAGASGIIAGCTEIELLVGPDDVDVPYFPTTRLHALAAVDWSLAAE